MDSANIVEMINSGKLDSAESIIEETIKINKSNADAWFLKGLVSLSRQSYDNAIECLMQSKGFGKDDDYVKRSLGYSYFSLFKMDESIPYFAKIKKKSIDDFFMLGIAYLLINDPMSSKEYIRSAYNIDASRTKELMKLFYISFIHPSELVSDKEKRDIVSKINALANESMLKGKK
jgi:tetratricopeptide (TPR) repeat protein